MTSSSSSDYDSQVYYDANSSTDSRSTLASFSHRLASDTEECESDDAYGDVQTYKYHAQTPLTLPCGRTMQSLTTVAWRWKISHEEAAALMKNVEDATTTPTPIFTTDSTSTLASFSQRLASDTEECESDDAYGDVQAYKHLAQTPLTIPSGRTMQSLTMVAWRWGISHEDAAALMQNVEDATTTPTIFTPASTPSTSNSTCNPISYLSSSSKLISTDKTKVQKSTSFKILNTIHWFFKRGNTIST